MKDKNTIEIERIFRVFWRRKFVFLSILIITLIITTFLTLRKEKIYKTFTTIATSPYFFYSPTELRSGPQVVSPKDKAYEILPDFLTSTIFYEKLNQMFKDTLFIENALGKYKVQVNSYRTGTGGNKIVIEVYATNPIIAWKGAIFTLHIVRNFINETTQKSYILTKEFINAQIPMLEKKLKELENKMQKFKEKSGVYEPKEEFSTLLKKKHDIEEQITKINMEINEIKLREKNLKNKLDKFGIKNVETPKINLIISTLANLEKEKTQLELQGVKDTAKINSIKAKINFTKNLLKKEINRLLTGTSDALLKDIEELAKLKADYAVKKGQKSILTDYLVKIKKQLKELPPKELVLSRIQREYKLAEEIYLMLKKKKVETELSKIKEQEDLIILDYPQKPTKPIKPNIKFNLILGLVLGLGLGLVGVIISEYADRTIREIEDLKDITDDQILIYIPNVSKEEDDFFNEILRDCFRRLRNKINLLKIDRKIKIIGITSSIKEEGKSFVSKHLAANYAFKGFKTLLIDLDYRNPQIHKIFGTKLSPGFTEYLINEVKSWQETPLKNLYIMPSGAIPPNPAEFLENEKVKEKIRKLTEIFDIILLDTPPANVFSDFYSLSDVIDVVIFVIKINTSQKDEIITALKDLKDKNLKTGIVVNSVGKTIYKKYHQYYSQYQKIDERK